MPKPKAKPRAKPKAKRTKKAISKGGSLTAMQLRFCDEYFSRRCKSQKEAAIAAGYSIKTADSQASQLRKNPKVIAYLEKKKIAVEKELRQEYFFDAIEARETMYKIMSNQSTLPSVRLQAAKDFLDRAGFAAEEKVALSGAIITSNEKLDNIVKQLWGDKGE